LYAIRNGYIVDVIRKFIMFFTKGNIVGNADISDRFHLILPGKYLKEQVTSNQ